MATDSDLSTTRDHDSSDDCPMQGPAHGTKPSTLKSISSRNPSRLRDNDLPSLRSPLVSTIFGLTYSGLWPWRRVPGLRIDRAGIALVGAAAMLACGVLCLPEAARAVDYETIVLLFGMMVVVAYLRLAGFFALATERIAARFSGPSRSWR